MGRGGLQRASDTTLQADTIRCNNFYLLYLRITFVRQCHSVGRSSPGLAAVSVRAVPDGKVNPFLRPTYI